MYSDVFPAFQRIQSTGDVLTDLTGRNISDYLVKTYTDLIRTRYYGPIVTNDSLTCSYVSRNSSYLCFCCTAWRASTGWMNRGMGVLNISRKYNDSTLWTLREHMHAFCDLSMWKDDGLFSSGMVAFLSEDYFLFLMWILKPSRMQLLS